MGFFWWEEKAATLKRRFCTNIYEPAPTSNSQQVWPDRWLVSQLDSLSKLEWEARSEGPLKPLKLERNLLSLPSKIEVHENYCTYYKLNYSKFEDTNSKYDPFAYWLPHEDRACQFSPIFFFSIWRYNCILSSITQQ